MTLANSGALSFTNIQTEFGGATPLSMNNYYAGGPNVPAGTYNYLGVTIPSSGAISFSNFYGATKFVATTRIYSTATTNATETIPAGAQLVVIEVIGGSGGGGGNGDSSSKNAIVRCGGGGGSGGLVRTSLSVKALGNTFTYTVGSAGTGGAGTGVAGAGTAGVAGGGSSVTSATLTMTTMSAGGGGGGGGGTASAGGTAGAAGTAAGGTVANTTGNPGVAGGSFITGTGGAGLVGTYVTGAAGGNGGGNSTSIWGVAYAGANGVAGKIAFAYT
jgi:hypothetical protein